MDHISNLHRIARLIITLGTFAITAFATYWCVDFATNSDRVGSDIALIIGAVMGPISLLQGAVFRFDVRHPHVDSKNSS